MYNPGITTTVGNYAEAANSIIQLIFVDTDVETGAKFCSMDITLPWGTLDQFFGGGIGDIITRSPDSSKFYAIKILDINITNQSATFQVLSYARGTPASVGVTNYNLPSIANPGSTINYDFELTNSSTTNVNIRWLFASKVTIQSDTFYPTANSAEALPPTIYKKLGCWYDDWAIGGTCANGQTIIGNNGTTHITGNFTVTTNTGAYENIALRVFVYVSNYWGTGKHEYVEVGGDGLFHQLSANYSHLECVSGICTRVTEAGTNTCNTIGSITECAQPPTATHYIEYDISSLPIEILDYIGPNIVYISNNIMDHLPSENNIKYISSEYNSGKFRIYVTYTPSLALTIEQHAMLWSFTLLFILIMFYTKAVTPWGIAAALILSAFGAVVIGCVIYDIKNYLPTTLQLSEKSPPEKINEIQTFSDTERAKCNDKYPCATTKTCTVAETNSYLLCIGLVDILQQTHDDTISGTFDETKFEDLLKRFNDLSEGLNDGSLTPEEVIDETNNITDETIANSDEKKDLSTCDPGFIYNPNTQTCVVIEDCWIPLPFGGCLLSAKTGKTLTYIGGGLLIGYIGYKIFVKK